MVDIALEILASSVPVRNGYMARYRVKTWWAHIDVPPDVTFIKLPRLPMIQPFLIMTGKDTTIFVETWQDHKNAIVGSGGGDGGIPVNRTRFLGMTTCSVDEQLKTPTLNPSVQWLDCHDPIEDASRGKLLIKIDAKFVLPEAANNSPSSRSENRHSLHGGGMGGGGGSHLDSPIKMVQSPRRSLAANFPFDYTNNSSISPARGTITNNNNVVSSQKSDTSVFSIGSISSTRSQDQWVQTDLSLPIIPDISKYTSALLKNPLGPSSTSASVSRFPDNQNNTTRRSVSSESSAITAIPAIPSVVDPLKFAEEILLRRLSTNDNNNTTTSKYVPGTTSSSSEHRRSSVKQPNGNLEQRRNYDMESLEDVIDMLNHDAIERDAVFSSPMVGVAPPHKLSNPQQKSVPIKASNSKPPLPKRSMDATTRYPTGNSSTALKRESIASTTTSSSLNQFQSRREESSSPTGGNSGTDTVREDDGVTSPFYYRQRFKEIHFDGAQAKQQATTILMTRTTANAAQQQSTNKPVVTRRRIAAAIFND